MKLNSVLSIAISLTLLVVLATFSIHTQAVPNNEMLTDMPVVNMHTLTKNERIWLEANQPIRVGVDGYFPPYSYLNDEKKIIGIAMDTLHLIGEKLDIDFVVDKQVSWQQVISNFNAKKTDMVLTMVKTPEREANYIFTTPIVFKSLVIINHKGNRSIDNREDIAGKTIALVKNYHYVSKILTEFPSVIPFYVDTMREALEAVESKQADAAITFFAAANFLQQKYLFTELEFAVFYERNSANDAIAIRHDMPMLASIMQKGLNAISSEEKLAINNKWHASIEIPTNYQQLIELSLISGFLILLLLVWLLQEKRHNKALIIAHNDTEAANQELNKLKDNLESLIFDRTTQLQNSENKYRGLVESLEDEYVFYQHDSQGNIQYVSPSVSHILGYEVADFIGDYRKYLTENHCNLLIPEFVTRSLKGEHIPPFEIEIFDTQGKVHSFEVLERPMYNEQDVCIGCEGIAHDVSALKQHQAKLHQLSHFDDLTGLANRYLFKLSLDQTILTAHALGQPFSLLFLDLTRFKIINDNLGHSAGDKLLQQAAVRLSGLLNNNDIVARFGGDKFCILLPNSNALEAEAKAVELIQVMAQPFEVYEQTFILGCRIGISLFPINGDDGETLLKQADAALYVAKKLPAGFAFCSEEQAKYNQRRLTLEQGLRLALSHSSLAEGFELFPVYQSINQLPETELAGFEALMRWHHPDLGPISPIEFIPIAEETGLIFELSRWMLAKVCHQLKDWHKQEFDFKRVSVNLSALELINVNLAEEIISLIYEAGAEPQWLKMEITETALMAAPEQSIKTLKKLVKAGIQVAIDDFGTGYSSLAYLKSLPATSLKIDQSFIRNLINSPEDQAVVKAVISMSHSLGKKVIAEGVETQHQLDFLTSHHCNLAQGYLFSRPLTAEDCVKKYAVSQPI
ncbi:EAL domain-containing protein [Shewanella sp. SR44-3]|uniref:EAL domain-containing protein n=1 Tax=Shewanella sp. SR44-3 TaxID=2760936 RepID=UPI0015FB00B1|nr:EAL domain-containing protein [Shewanella sp. SR44-3]MBB1268458.1 EAL domain-containing protein [Shewanella sp. SR44-3]